jgi:hypothetical protein
VPQGRIPATGVIVHSANPLGTEHESSIRYVNLVGVDGWMQARDDATGQLIALPKYTKVRVSAPHLGRVSLRVQEGLHRGRMLSLSESNARLHLGAKAPTLQAARITVVYGRHINDWVSVARRGQQIDQQMATMSVNGLTVAVTMNSVWNGKFTPLDPGEYEVLLPDVPHRGNMTTFYRDSEPSLHHDQVWFPIRHGNNSRYIHVGNISDGCVTVLDLARWADIHEALISHRAPDGRSVATLTVRGKPERSR